MDANETRWDHAQTLREIKEIPRTGHMEVARQEIIRLEAENARLRTALHDAINRPMGVVPDSAVEFYDIESSIPGDEETFNNGAGW